ncbi:MAG: hypothetical protein LAN83_01345 [Acidobacteriia bacterium]|nr:hypothetical protein [Terriglobia bacterium]
MAEDLKPEGLRGLLLGPLVLLAELVGALIPGVLFLILLIVKRVPEATAAIGTTFIGYRTKIACGLVISFLIGRLFLIPANLLQARLLSFGTQDLNLFDANKQGSIFDKLTKEGKKLLGGALMTGFLRGATPWEHYMVAMSEGGFRLSTGFALLVACLIPGDGRMRTVELLGGMFFVGFGVLHGRATRGLALALIGSSAAEGFLSLTEQQRTLVFTLARILLPSQTQAAPPPLVAKEPGKGSLAPQAPPGAVAETTPKK